MSVLGVRCPNCGHWAECGNLTQHHRRNPACFQAITGADLLHCLPANDEPATTTELQQDNIPSQLVNFSNRCGHSMMAGFNKLYKSYVSDEATNALCTTSTALLSCLEDEVAVSRSEEETRQIFAAARRVITNLHSPARRFKYNVEILKVPFIEPILYQSLTREQSKSFAVRFNVVQTITRILQAQLSTRVRPRIHLLRARLSGAW